MRLALAAALLVLATAHDALAADLVVRWMQPAGSPPVERFRVYRGSVIGQGKVVFEGMPASDAGVYSVRLPMPKVAAGTTLYYWVAAVLPSGEGRHSRPLVLGRPAPALGTPGRPVLVLD